MAAAIELECKCGQVHGWLRGAEPGRVNRVICYCEDCQAFLHYLGRADLLDERGGSDITQVAPASITFDRGVDRMAGLKLGPKGLFRWYARCCNTPLGNTLAPSLPFVGIVHELFRGAPDAAARDAAFGPPIASVRGHSAIGGAPEGSTGLSLALIFNSIRLLATWKVSGRSWPNPFFDHATGKPRPPVSVLGPAERAALRHLCGPHPTPDRAETGRPPVDA